MYHVIGGGTGDWDVPIGGMGAVSGELTRAARQAGAEIITSAEVSAIRGGAPGSACEVDVVVGGETQTLEADWVLANVSPWVLG